MSKIKSVSQFEDNVWSESTPIGADASNIDVEMSDSSIKDLQTVLGDIPSTAASIQSQLNNKVTASGGNIQSTVVTTGIQNYDNSSLSDETSTALLDANVRVVNAQDTAASMWTKFNRFRRRVDNKFKDIFLSSVEDVASPSLTQTYSQSALNNYFSNIIGYTSAADLPTTGNIASQLSSLQTNYIIEQGSIVPSDATSPGDEWYYRKWNNNIIEYWRNITWVITTWTAWGGVYYSNESDPMSVPNNIQTITSIQTSGFTSRGDAWLAHKPFNMDPTSTLKFLFIRGSALSGETRACVNIYMLGELTQN